MASRPLLAMRSSSGNLLKVAGLLAVALASSWMALQLLDYWEAAGSGSRTSSIPNLIQITEATYGLSCLGRGAGVKAGNATDAVTKICDKAIDDCKFIASVGDFGDPAPG